MAKILNLDGFASKAERRFLKIGDTSYAVEEMTVGNFIETTKAAEKLEKAGGNYAEQFELSVDMVLRSIPAISRDILQKFSLHQLQAVISFVRGDDVPEATDGDDVKVEKSQDPV